MFWLCMCVRKDMMSSTCASHRLNFSTFITSSGLVAVDDHRGCYLLRVPLVPGDIRPFLHPLLPLSTIFPASFSRSQKDRVHRQITHLLSLLRQSQGQFGEIQLDIIGPFVRSVIHNDSKKVWFHAQFSSFRMEIYA